MEEGFVATSSVCRRPRRTRIEYLSQSRRLYARARSSIDTLHHPSGLIPECALSHAARMMLLMGMLRKRKGKMRVSRWRRGRKIGKPKKLERFDDEAPGGVEDRASLSIDRWRNALGERGSRRVRARGSFVRAGRDATSVEMTHSGRSLTRNPARRPRRPRSREAAGGRSFETRDRSRGRMRLIRGGVSDGRGKRS